jgi:hypothetical protein
MNASCVSSRLSQDAQPAVLVQPAQCSLHGSGVTAQSAVRHVAAGQQQHAPVRLGVVRAIALDPREAAARAAALARDMITSNSASSCVRSWPWAPVSVAAIGVPFASVNRWCFDSFFLPVDRRDLRVAARRVVARFNDSFSLTIAGERHTQRIVLVRRDELKVPLNGLDLESVESVVLVIGDDAVRQAYLRLVVCGVVLVERVRKGGVRDHVPDCLR